MLGLSNSNVVDAEPLSLLPFSHAAIRQGEYCDNKAFGTTYVFNVLSSSEIAALRMTSTSIPGPSSLNAVSDIQT